jgi:hypothetical protein
VEGIRAYSSEFVMTWPFTTFHDAMPWATFLLPNRRLVGNVSGHGQHAMEIITNKNTFGREIIK